MKKIFLAAGIMLIAATVTFAHNNNIGRKERKEARIEKRETRKEHRREHRAENRNEVSDLTRSQFPIDFPDAKNVRFEKTDSNNGYRFLFDPDRVENSPISFSVGCYPRLIT